MNKFLLLIPAFLLAACGVDKQSALEDLQQIRELHYRAHVNRDAELLVNTFADNFRLIQDGRVSQPEREASLQQFQAYFDSVTFQAWDDIDPPVIHISDDGHTAWVVVTKYVQIVPRDAGSDADGGETYFAWLETWQRINGEWKITTLTSTQQPSAP